MLGAYLEGHGCGVWVLDLEDLPYLDRKRSYPCRQPMARSLPCCCGERHTAESKLYGIDLDRHGGRSLWADDAGCRETEWRSNNRPSHW